MKSTYPSSAAATSAADDKLSLTTVEQSNENAAIDEESDRNSATIKQSGGKKNLKFSGTKSDVNSTAGTAAKNVNKKNQANTQNQASISKQTKKTSKPKAFGWLRRGAKVIRKVALEDIIINKQWSGRIIYDEFIVSEYAKLIDGGAQFPRPVLVEKSDKTLIIADGFYRIEAYRKLKRTRVDVEIFPGDERDAFLIGLDANTKHGIRLSREEKRENIKRILADPVLRTFADRHIGKICSVAHGTIGRYRDRLNQPADAKRRCIRGGKEIEMEAGKINKDRHKPVEDSTGNKESLPDGVDQSFQGDSSSQIAKSEKIKRANEISPGAVELDKIEQVQFGDCFLIKDREKRGYHQAMCGDSTDEADLAMLLGYRVADLYLTDPPYNAAIPRNRSGQNSGATNFIPNNNMDEKEFSRFLTKSLTLANKFLKPGAPFYIWSSFTSIMTFCAVINKELGKLNSPLIWVKKNFVKHPYYNYSWGHEMCLYGWTKGAKHFWSGSSSASTVIDGKNYEDRPFDLKKDHHPCPKPVLINKMLIENSSREGDVVYDGFLGGGSTLIAAHLSNRLCYGIEYMPQYLAVILDRARSLELEVIKVRRPAGKFAKCRGLWIKVPGAPASTAGAAGTTGDPIGDGAPAKEKKRVKTGIKSLALAP